MDHDAPKSDPGPAAPVRDARVHALRGAEPRGPTSVDRVAAEAPLEIRLGGNAATVLMRTPGGDEELVRGFLFNEGLVSEAADIVAMRRPAATGDEAGNVIDVELVPSRYVPLQRLFYSSSSCGVCGKNSIGALAIRAEPSRSSLAVKRAALAALPARMREAQAAYRETGGVHAAALFDAGGKIIAVREDVGRHNAVDKLAGWALDLGLLPLEGTGLLVSGRVSFEILQKAIALGAPIVGAVGAPTSLAIDLALRYGIALVGFLRADTMTVYAHAQRVLD